MKKIIRILGCLLVMLTAFTVWVSAADSENGTYDYTCDGAEYTVEFIETSLSPEEQEVVAQRLLSNEESSVQTYGVWCTLFGHDLTTSKVAVIRHKVYTYSPRCVRDVYDVQTCSKCDYQTSTFSSSGDLCCCPEE